MNTDNAKNEARVLVGVCTYEEATNVESLIRKIRESLPTADVLLVDDDSPDGTADLATALATNDPRIRVIVRHGERGLGSAIVHAASVAVDEDYDFFLNLDGDLSHDPQDLPRLLGVAVDDAEVDVVIGSRYVAGGSIEGWPWRRRWMSKMVNRFGTACLRLPVSDCSGSIRCYRVNALKRVGLSKLRCEGYALLEELLLRLCQQGCKLAEVPITFTERQRGHSKLTMGEAFRSVSFMLRLAVSRKS